MKTFEIHLYQRGRWNIDSSFDDRELALFEARRIEEGGRYVGIRVVEETFNEATQQVSNRTIFRGARLDQLNTDKTAATGAPRQGTARQPRERGMRRKAGRRTRAAPAVKRTFSPARVALLLLLLLAAAAAGALTGLQYLHPLL